MGAPRDQRCRGGGFCHLRKVAALHETPEPESERVAERDRQALAPSWDTISAGGLAGGAHGPAPLAGGVPPAASGDDEGVDGGQHQQQAPRWPATMLRTWA